MGGMKDGGWAERKEERFREEEGKGDRRTENEAEGEEKGSMNRKKIKRKGEKE